MRTVSVGRLFPRFLLPAAFLAVLLSASGAVALPPDPHAFFREAAQCPKCHFEKDSRPDPSRFTVSSVDFCLECHLADGGDRTHPVKVVTSGKIAPAMVPPDFRLGDGLRIICLTCHSAHGAYLSNVQAFAGQLPVNDRGGSGDPVAYRTFFLRRSNPAQKGFEALCRGCHKTP